MKTLIVLSVSIILLTLTSCTQLATADANYQSHVAARQIGVQGYAKDNNQFGGGVNYRVEYR